MPVIDGRGTRPVVQSGDLAFLQQKEQEGKLKTAEGTLTSVGDIASITAGTNRDLYLASAKISARNTDISNANQSVTIALKLNGVVIETWNGARQLFGGGTGASWQENNYEFVIGIGKKVSASEIIKLEITSITSGWTITGALEAWEESSGSQQFGAQTITVQSDGSDLAFLRNKERDGDLVKILSPEFSADADQITFIPPNGKTFFFSRARLYPVVGTITLIGGSLGNTSLTRRADIEITNDGTIVDVLTHDHQSRQADADMSSGVNAGQYESNVFDSLVGDGIKEFKLVSTNTSGTFRVSLFGWLEDT